MAFARSFLFPHKNIIAQEAPPIPKLMRVASHHVSLLKPKSEGLFFKSLFRENWTNIENKHLVPLKKTVKELIDKEKKNAQGMTWRALSNWFFRSKIVNFSMK